MRSIHSILLDLNETSANIEASAIISTDGLIMAAALPQGMDEDCVGALSAALHSVGSHSTQHEKTCGRGHRPNTDQRPGRLYPDNPDGERCDFNGDYQNSRRIGSYFVANQAISRKNHGYHVNKRKWLNFR